MSNKIDTIIFDLDGTLLNSLTDLANSVNYVMERYGFPVHPESQVQQMVGNGIGVLLEKAIPEGRAFSKFDDCLKDFHEHYNIHKKDFTKPYPGILEFLKDAAASGYKMAIVSNKPNAAAKALCQDFFSPYITTAIGESSQIARKPAPDTVFAAMKELDSVPEQCVYVGDSEVDMATAVNSGIPCISVSWGFRERSFLLEHGADKIADTPEDVKRILSEI